MTETITERCEAKGLRMTGQRRTIAGVLEDADDHPDVEELYARASAADPNISPQARTLRRAHTQTLTKGF